MTSAARDTLHEASEEIIAYGCKYRHYCCVQEREAKNQRRVPVPERHIDTELTGAAELLEEMKDSLDRIGRESLAEDMQATLWNTVFYISRGEAAWQIKNAVERDCRELTQCYFDESGKPDMLNYMLQAVTSQYFVVQV